ncbi:hypothetical protein BGX29_002592, partial [Mortierella sp. GBA35]
DQIDEYIDQFRNNTSTRLLFGDQPVWSTKEYMDKLTAIPNLMDLVKNPFLLSLALKTLPMVVDTKQDLSRICITRVGLYDKFVTQWLEIDMWRLQNNNLSKEEHTAFNLLKDDDFVRSGIDYMKRLSAALFKEQNGNPAVQYSHIRDKHTWKAEFFSPDPEVRLLRESSPLTRTGNLYRIIHRSVMEYFYSCKVYDPNNTNSYNNEFAPQPPSPSTSLLGSISEHPLSQRNLVAEPSIIQFLVERVQSNPVFKQQLLNIIELSKTDPLASRAAANAITILVKAKAWFNEADLRGIRVPGADLSGGQFDSAQLQGADLVGADFTRTWIRQVNFSNTRMEGVRFGELPFMEEDTTVIACAYSPDGKTFASALEDHTIKLYDTTAWKMIRQFRGHTSTISSIAYSPCSKRLVSSSVGTVRLWDCETGLSSFVLEDDSEWARLVAYSPTGRQVASGGYETEVRLWDPDTGALLFVLEGYNDCFSCLAFSPDGCWLASDSEGKTIRLCDTQTAYPGAVLSTTHEQIRTIAFSPDGQRIVAGLGDDYVQLFSTVTGEHCLALSGHTGRVVDLSFSPSGQWIATASQDMMMIKLWDTQTGTLVTVFAGHSSSITGVTFAPDGTHLTTSSYDHTVRHWELNLAGSVPDSQDRSDPVTSVACSHDDRWIISSRSDGTIQQYDAVTGESGYVYPGEPLGADHVAFSPTSPLFASVGVHDTDVKMWNADTGALHHVLLGHTAPISSIAFSPCGNWIASCSYDKTIRFWDVRTGTQDHILEDHTDDICHLAFSPDNYRMVSCRNDKTIRVWEMDGNDSRIIYVARIRIYRMTYSPRGQQIASLTIDNETCILDEHTGEVLHTLKHEYTAVCPQYSSCGEWLAIGGPKKISIWRVASVGDSEEWKEVVKIGGFAGIVSGLAWKSHTLELITGWTDGSVRVWRILEMSDGCSAQLVWGDGYAVLWASNANLAEAVGLSVTNRHLLEQRGAVVESTATADSESKEDGENDE